MKKTRTVALSLTKEPAEGFFGALKSWGFKVALPAIVLAGAAAAIHMLSPPPPEKEVLRRKLLGGVLTPHP